MMWLGDFMRFWWGLLYWNLCKSIFRLRKNKTRSPCQHPSDSGRALETACDAAQDWHKPARFMRVCPLLVETPAGLRCSADAKYVRPFWGRAGIYFMRGAIGVCVVGALLLFVVLRLTGYPLSPLAVIWPPRWHEIRLARSDYFAAKARHALDAHQVSEAILSLDLACRDNPLNYEAGLQLAQLTSIGRPEYADSIFAGLVRNFPDRRASTSEAWLRSLLVHGNLARAAELAASRMLDDAPRRPAWLHALFNSTRHSGDDRPLRALVSQQATSLEPIDIALINSELLIRQGRGLDLLPGLTTELPPSAGAYAPFFQVDSLNELGRHTEALALLDRYRVARRMAEADEYQLRLNILAALGRGDLLRARLAQAPVNAREFELISVHLVRHPDPATVAALGACVQRSGLKPDNATYSGYAAFLVACGAAGDWQQMHGAAGALEQIVEMRGARLAALEAFFRQKSGARFETILTLLPGLSFDLIYAIYDHYEKNPPTLADCPDRLHHTAASLRPNHRCAGLGTAGFCDARPGPAAGRFSPAHQEFRNAHRTF
jgi:hypothetical protein